MSRPIQGLALASVLLICLLVSAPARLVGLVLPSGQVAMDGFSGTVWNGSASRALVRTAAGYLHLGSVQWQLSPWSLVLLSPRLSVDSHWGRQKLTAELVIRGQQDLDLAEVDARFDADIVRHFAPVLLGGTFSLQLDTLQLREGRPVRGAGKLVWQDGRWLSPQGPLLLGSYALDFEQLTDQPLVAQVITLAGPVEASGTVQLQDQSYAVDIMLGSEQALDPQLERALSLIARPTQGRHHIKLEGEI